MIESSEKARPQREHWGTRLGLVLAMAGNAIGLGNFLRFPGQAATHGGGAFMIPYFLSFLLMGIPLMWLEWAQGRYGGRYGHGSTPGIFQVMWRHPIAKYLGVLGLFVPTVILIYYTYIASWTLGYSVLSLLGQLPKIPAPAPGTPPEQIPQTVLKPFEDFRIGYVGEVRGDFLYPSILCYCFFLITLALNVWVLIRGITQGIERLARITMPLLFLFALILAIRTLTLGEVVQPGRTPMDGLRFLWEPQWYVEREGKQVFVLLDPGVWLAAAGQIFFTLSLGMGAIQCYASYVKEEEDVVLTGLSTASANEFCEVVLGSSITIPAAAAFFGITTAQLIAQQGSFYLGFTSMPAIFSVLPAGALLSFLWFLLLFFAAFTSTVAMAQPLITFFEDEMGWSRPKAVLVLTALWFPASQMCLFLRDSWQVMDFWSGTFGPVLTAFVEVVLMMWIFGAERMWEEMHRGAQLYAPRFFYYLSKYIIPLLLLSIFGGFLYQTISGEQAGKTLEGFNPGPTIWFTRLFLIITFVGLCILVHKAFSRSEVRGE